jgi:hypothetical protein
MKVSKKQAQQRAAAERREAKRLAHEAMMARHAERKAAISLWETAYDAWIDADCKGPRPIHPDNLRGIVHDDGDDLLRAAAELGIDIERNVPIAA